MAETLWPIPKFNFSVELGSLGEISFSEISGLEMETQMIEYRNGNSLSLVTQKIPGLKKHGNISLKKGVYEGDHNLWEWFKSVQSDPEGNREDVTINLNDEEGNPLLSWSFQRCFPVKITLPDMKSDANEIAIEALELTHEGFELLS